MKTITGMRCVPFAAALLGMLGMDSGVGRAQENELRILVPRLERIESDLADLQRRVARGGGGGAPAASSMIADPSSNALIRLDDRLTLMERQLAELTGRVEETGYRLEQLRARLDKQVADNEFRFSQLEGGGKPVGGATAGREEREGPPPVVLRPPGQGGQAAAQQQAAAASAVPRGGPVLPEGSPMDRYNFAIGLLARQDYPAAEAAFREFVSSHPSDRLAGNAQYWLGETYYVRNDMTKAAQTFLEGVKKYPDGAKSADTMLKLGMSLTAINQKTEACGVFGEMKNRFPNLSRDTATGLAAARERANCR